ncbi:MAG TPA: signal peptide peptidase SppA [Thermoplasmata archaeon]|nr:signal peptide peptidase SppA [Thermoplasmata archaeon]
MRERLAHVTFRGTIRERSVEPYLRLLRALRTRRRIKGVLLDISSGGGESIASTDLYLAVKRLDHEKPVFAAIGSIGASGAYMAALGARRIFAYPDSTVGSIGVVYPHLAVRDLARRLGIEIDLLHMGEHKDAFQGLRPLTEVERTKMLGVIAEGYEGFVRLVAQERHQPVETVRALSTGEVWTGAQALKLGLLDGLGDREIVLEELARATGVSAQRTIRVAPPRSFVDRLLSGNSNGFGGLSERIHDVVEETVLDLGGFGLRR